MERPQGHDYGCGVDGLMWQYKIGTGIMSENGKPRPEVCYSGFDEHKNDPSMVGVPNVGPIPPGKYKIGLGYTHTLLGPVVMNLDPLPGTNTLGRSLFRIHGDNANHNASHGCIIAPRTLRLVINASQDRILEVTE